MDYNKILLRGRLSKIYSEIQERDREGKNEEESQQQGVPLTTLPVKSLMSKPWADNQDCGLSHGFISMPILSRNTVLCQGPICSFYAVRTAVLIKWLNKDFENIFHWGKTWKNTLKSKLKARLTVSLPCPDGFLLNINIQLMLRG